MRNEPVRRILTLAATDERAPNKTIAAGFALQQLAPGCLPHNAPAHIAEKRTRLFKEERNELTEFLL